MKRITLLAAFFKDGKIQDHTYYLIDRLAEVSKVILFSDSPIETPHLNKLKHLEYVHCERHDGYDFGSWKRAFFWAKQNGYLQDCEEIIFANDSVIGPAGNIGDYFEAKEQDGNPPFYGISINSFGYKDILSRADAVYSPHIQSYFFTVSREIFTKKFFLDFWKGVKKEDAKLKYVINYEMGLSKLIRGKGYDLKCMYKSYLEHPHNPAALEPYSVLDEALFVKKSMLPKIDLNKINSILESKKYPYKFECKININKSLNLVSITQYQDHSIFYLTSEFDHKDLKMCLSTTHLQLFLKPIREVDSIYLGLEKHFQLFNKYSYFFRVDKKYIGRDVSFNASLVSDLLPHNTLKEYYPRIERNKLILNRDKVKFLEEVYSSKCYSDEDKTIINLIHKIDHKDRIYSLFADKGNLRADSAWELFKYSNSPNDFYLVDKRLPNDPPNIIERHSVKHVMIFLASKNLITSFYYKALIPRQIKEIHISLLNHNFIYIPHGITAGHNNSLEVSVQGGTTPNKILCGSEYEFKNFKKLGHPSVHLAGYPRCDKWTEVPLKDQVILFFTWRKSLHNLTVPQFIKSNYVKTISKIIDRINKPIYYFPHNSLPLNKLKALRDKFKGKVNFVLNDSDQFNQIFNESKYLITDISSVGYDFAYKNRKALFYVEEEFLRGHYVITDLFRETCGGIMTSFMSDIDRYLEIENTGSQEGVFWKYSDNENCKRAKEHL